MTDKATVVRRLDRHYDGPHVHNAAALLGQLAYDWALRHGREPVLLRWLPDTFEGSAHGGLHEVPESADWDFRVIRAEAVSARPGDAPPLFVGPHAHGEECIWLDRGNGKPLQLLARPFWFGCEGDAAAALDHLWAKLTADLPRRD